MMRSWLFVPANDGRKIAKALASEADMLILDLEDAVAHARKDEARVSLAETYVQLLDQADTKEDFQREWRRRVCLRINASAEGMADIGCADRSGIGWIMLPKAERAADIVRLAEHWRRSVNHRLRLVPLIETAFGVEQAVEIAGSHPCVHRLALGTIDLANDLGIDISEDQSEFQYARSKLVMASAACKLAKPIDSVETAIDDAGQIQAQAANAKRLGFGGKMAIHPKQLVPIHSVWQAESEESQSDALLIVEAFEKAEKEGLAAIRVDGRMVDYPVYEQALRRLNRQTKER